MECFYINKSFILFQMAVLRLLCLLIFISYVANATLLEAIETPDGETVIAIDEADDGNLGISGVIVGSPRNNRIPANFLNGEYE